MRERGVHDEPPVDRLALDTSAVVTGTGFDSLPREAAESVAGGSPFQIAEAERYEAPLLVGEGALGRVFAVTDQRLGRVVAMKTIQSDAPSELTRQRFLREAMLTASLDHPDIVSVHDAGTLPDGSFFYTMRLIAGRPLDEAIQEAPDQDARLRLLRPLQRAIEAVAYAHARGVLHRDLKPSNIMLSEFGQVQVVDWGLAVRAAEARASIDRNLIDINELNEFSENDADDGDDSQLTRVGAVVGTPAYMSPEQADGRPATCASDVWSLGATLFEVLTGRRLRGGVQKAVDALGADVPPELGAIVARAVASNPDDRYPSAHELASDLGAYLDGLRVSAHRYSPLDNLRRVLRAWRTPLVISLVALIATGVIGGVSWRAAILERDRAQAAEAETQLAEGEARRASDDARRQLAQTLTEQAVRHLADGALMEAGIMAAEALARDPELPAARGVLAGLPETPPLTLTATAQLPDTCRQTAISLDAQAVACIGADDIALWRIHPFRLVWRAPIESPRSLRFIEDLDVLEVTAHHDATGNRSRTIFGFRLAVEDGHPSGQPLWTLGDPTHIIDGARWRVDWTSQEVIGRPQQNDTNQFSFRSRFRCEDNKELVAVAVDMSRETVVVFCKGHLFKGDLETGVAGPPRALSGLATVTAAASVMNGLTLGGDVLGAIGLFDPESGALVARADAGRGMVRDIQASQDGKLALVTFDGSAPLLWRVDAWQPAVRLPEGLGGHVAMTSDERTLTAIDATGRLRQYAVTLERPRRVPTPEGLNAAHLSRDRRTVAAVSHGAWVTRDDGERLVNHASRRLYKDGAFSADGARFYATDLGGGLDVWDTNPWRYAGLVGQGARAGRHVVARTDGWIVVAIHALGLMLMRDDGVTAETELAMDVRVADLAVSPNRRHAAAVSRDGDLVVFTSRPNEAPLIERPTAPAGSFAVAVDDVGDLVLAHDGGVDLIDTQTMLRTGSLSIAGRNVLDLAIAPDGKHIATAERDGRAGLLSRETGALVTELRGHTERVAGVSFSADGAILVTAGWDRQARLWRVGPDALGEATIEGLRVQWAEALGLALETLLKAQ